MSNNRIDMVNIKHILRLLLAGEKKRSIARTLGIGRRTVNRYVACFEKTGQRYEALNELSSEALLALLSKGKKEGIPERYKQLKQLFPKLEVELKKVGATYLILWESYRQSNPNGYAYTQFTHHLRRWMTQTQVSLHWEHKFGDKLFVDFCGKTLCVTDKLSGEVQKVEVLVAVLGGSQYTYVEAVWSQKLDHFLDALQNAFHFFGGVPRGIVPDNLKSAVSKADKYEPDVNRNLSALALHYGTTILPTRSRKPKDKPLAENGVNLIYQRIYYPLSEVSFYNLEDLNRAISTQLDGHNNRLFVHRPYSRKQCFLEQEKHLLEGLPTQRYERRQYYKTKVNKDGRVYFQYHYYSVPFHYKGKSVKIQATRRVVEVFLCSNHQRIVLHQRSYQKGGYTIVDAHLPDNVRFVKNWSIDFFLAQGKAIGATVEQYFQKIFDHKTHPEQGYKICTGILSLRKTFSDDRLIAACKRADYFNNYGYKVIKNILAKGLDQVDYQPHCISDQQPTLDAAHPNIRGGQYYE